MSKLIALSLNLIVLLPSIYGITHVLHGNHKVCNESSLHFHEHEYDCLTCDFLINEFDYAEECTVIHKSNTHPKKVETQFYSNFIKINLDFKSNRGPPTVV